MIPAVRALLQKHREAVSYVFWGVMTTLVNYAAYFLLRSILHVPLVPTNTAAWVVSVLFAYFVNKLFVFESKSWAWRVAVRELWQMTAVLPGAGNRHFVAFCGGTPLQRGHCQAVRQCACGGGKLRAEQVHYFPKKASVIEGGLRKGLH